MTKLIVGLGNPGEKYKNNRHNVGFQVVDRLRTTVYSQVPWEENKKLNAVVSSPSTVDVILAKPTTFMNDSGRAVQALVKWFKIKPGDLYIVHDDLDIPLGGYKIQKGKGPELHYGVNSIDEALGTRDYWRVRVGVDNRDPENRISGEQYTLEDFTKEEEREILKNVLRAIVDELQSRYVADTQVK